MKAAEECVVAIFEFWSFATHTRLAAWYVLYFLLQATLIPIHCLRRNPSHADAQSWRSSILTALSIINAMDNLNPSAPKCRDIIHRLCGQSLNVKPRTLSQPQAQTYSQQESPWSPYATDPSFSNPFTFQSPDAMNSMDNPWMTEIDTAINGYDAYVDRLSNAAMAGMGHPPAEVAEATQMQGVFTSSDEIPNASAVQSWDWGLNL
jgi:transcriptional regulatory protein GAL4